MNVYVASRNPVKLEATRDAFTAWFRGRAVDVHAVASDRSLPEQPLGEDVCRGAVLRARAAIERPGADYGVGIEAGLVRMGGCERWFAVQVCAVADRDGRMRIGIGPGFELPEELRDAVLGGEPLRDALCRLRGADAADRRGAIHHLSAGRADRYETTLAAVRMALATT